VKCLWVGPQVSEHQNSGALLTGATQIVRSLTTGF
jgi:hypothetical protein